MSCPGSSAASPLKALLDTELGKFGVVAQALVREPCAVPATPQLRIDCGGRDAKRGGNVFGAQACLNHLLDFLPLLIRAESVVCQCVHLLTGIKKLSYTTNLLVCNSIIGAAPEDMEQLERTMKQGAVNGCTGLEMIDEAKLHELVPAVVGKFAMWSKNSGIMDPFLYTVALAENAHANSVDFFFDHKVEAITRENELYYLHTAHGDFCTRWVVNAAGLGAKQISDLLGLTGYRVIGSRSNYIILHKRMGKLLPMPVYPVPSNTYMGIHITPTVDGNVTVGPDAENTDVLDDYGVPQANMDSLAVEGAKLWPHIFKKDQIRTFAGIQPKWVDENGAIQDWKVEIRDDVAPNAVNLVGIESPGLTGSVPLARYVIGLMQEREKFEENPDFDPHHKGIVKFAECTPEQQAELIAQDPDYGEMICSCEEVTKAEILQAIHNPLGVSTMTGIKYRTRAMMGGCQGGFCQMKIEHFIEQELGTEPENVRYSRQGSWVLTGNMRKEEN